MDVARDLLPEILIFADMKGTLRHAYCIIAHDNPRRLALLVSLLDDGRNDIFVLIDGRSSMDSFKEAVVECRHSRVLFMDNPPKIYWGDYSMVKAILMMLQWVREYGDYGRYHLLSGADLPIKTQDFIHRFCDELHPGEQLLQISDDPSDREDLERKMSVRNLFSHYARREGHGIIGRYAGHWLWRLSRDVQLKFKLRKRVPDGIFKSEVWWSLTKDAVCCLLDSEQWIRRTFSHAVCADELFVASALMKEKGRFRFYDGGGGRLIDWERGEPYVWQGSDFDELAQSECLFARKFPADISADFITRVIGSHKKADGMP